MPKLDTVLDWLWPRLVILLLLFATPFVKAAVTTITFTVDEPCKTSAGVFLPNGTLVRTLWNKMPYYAAGTYSVVWDGLDDCSNAMPGGTYEFKLLQHNTEYVWDGAIGNTSEQLSGPGVHRGFYFMQDMAISGNNAYYVSGYNEGQYSFRSFLTTDPQNVTSAWYWDINGSGQLADAPGSYPRVWNCTTTDGNWVYFACSSTYDPVRQQNYGGPGCVVACNVSDDSLAYFTDGAMITNVSADAIPNCIGIGTQPGLDGLSVQQNGNLLAVAVGPDNMVYLLDKRSGAAIYDLSVNSPGRLNFSPDGSLWVISAGNVFCYTNLTSNPLIAATISGLSEPLDVAVNPTNSNIILVADGGSSQQVKAFNSVGAPLWTYGMPGGYLSNGVAVTTNKFWFSYEGVDQTFLCFAPDGSFWVGDEENHRSLHFSAACAYIEQIMYQPHSYRTCVDQNNPSRVFNQFLEFQVDYTKPLSQAWTLVNNWKANVPTNNDPSNDEGIYEVSTLTNGRTYALIDNTSYQYNPPELCELVSNQWLRLTGILPLHSSGNCWISLGVDGSVGSVPMGTATWYKATLNGFDTNNNPVWNPQTLLASAPQGGTDPIPRCCSGTIYAAISTNNILLSYDSTLNNGWHFGGMQLGTTNWLWKAGPSLNLNGCGNYEVGNGLTYAGNMVYAIDRNVYFGYHGEFFRSQGQAGQHFHYYDDGLFVGQFGEASVGHSAYEGALPGFAGNGYSPCFMKTATGDYYLWVNDESAHGPQRWHYINARNIREQSGFGILGSSVVLTNQSFNFPVALTAQNGSQSGMVSWMPLQGAPSYNIYYSTLNGGPYNIFAGSTTGTNFLVTGLTNGQTYFVAVTAIQGGIEGIPSEQVEIAPFDTTQTVLCEGSLTEGGQSTPVVDVSSSAVSSNLFSLIGSEHLTGLLTPRDLAYYGYGTLMNKTIGSQGYLLYDWGGPGSNLTNLAPSFTITNGPGWVDINYLERQYRVNGVLGTNMGLAANPVGTINIGVSDNNFHYLTVIAPAQFNNARTFALGITSVGGRSVHYTVNDTPGYTHTFQFLFRGNITLWARTIAGSAATVQGIFLDNAAAVYDVPAPSNLHVVITRP